LNSSNHYPFSKIISLDSTELETGYVNPEYILETIEDLNNVCLCINTSDISISSGVLQLLIDKNITVIISSPGGIYKFGKAINSYAINYNALRLDIVKQQSILVTKRRYNFLRRQYRDRNSISEEELKQFKIFYNYSLQQIQLSKGIDSINGYLGLIHAKYYALLGKFFIDDIEYYGKRKDSIAQMCIVFLESLLEKQIRITLIANNVSEEISLFRHSEKHKCGALVADLKFEMSPYLIDPILIKVFNLKTICASDFNEYTEDVLPEIIQKKLAQSFSNKLKYKFKYPNTKMEVNYSDAISIRVQQIKNICEDGSQMYNPFYLR
jgi:CRISPR/Cas system-associated endonuclease Cas1